MTRALPHDAQVAPSILSSDFARLGELVQTVMDAGATVIHCDVMDGHFVPPITIGPLIVGAIADQVHGAGGLLDVHLMIERPERQVAEFATAGADNITFHYEATPHVHYTANTIREAGCQAGVAICPGTPVEALSEIAPHLDLALCMSVNPGWGGQRFIPTSVGKLERLRALVGPDVVVEVDGGIDQDTAASVVRAGATLLVAGSAIFGEDDAAAAYRQLTAALGGG
ncbi:MAG: ribulose-phosphate 3-epimerase [Actinomycetota bacterium]|nr:ribulose-phosphate 3-epimerase [Actinomycetota bacterium]